MLAMLISLWVMPYWLPAQTNDLLIDGTVMADTNTPLLEASIRIIDQHGDEYRNLFLTTSDSGRFELRFPFDDVFDVRIEREGYVAKILVIDTRNVPLAEQEWGYEFGGFKVILDEPALTRKEQRVVVIHYDDDIQNFRHQPISN